MFFKFHCTSKIFNRFSIFDMQQNLKTYIFTDQAAFWQIFHSIISSIKTSFCSGIWLVPRHYNDVIMGVIVSPITSLTIVDSIIYSDADQRKHQSSTSLAFVRGIHRGPVNSPHKWPVTQKMFPFDDVIMAAMLLVASQITEWEENSKADLLTFTFYWIYQYEVL